LPGAAVKRGSLRDTGATRRPRQIATLTPVKASELPGAHAAVRRTNAMTSPDGLQHIVLTMARCPEFPEGSERHGYSLRAPLDALGFIDPVRWKETRTHCVVRRFWGDEPARHGMLVHSPDGTTGATWAFDYDPDRASDDEAGYRLGEHAFIPGEYVSVRDEGGAMHSFVVKSVDG